MCSRKQLRQVIRWVKVYCLICFAPVCWKTIIANMSYTSLARFQMRNQNPQTNKYEFQRITRIHSLYNCNCRLNFSLQNASRRDRLYKDTPNGGYKGLEMCLRSIPAEPFKILNHQHILFFFFFSFFFLTKGIFLYASTIEK